MFVRKLIRETVKWLFCTTPVQMKIIVVHLLHRLFSTQNSFRSTPNGFRTSSLNYANLPTGRQINNSMVRLKQIVSWKHWSLKKSSKTKRDQKMFRSFVLFPFLSVCRDRSDRQFDLCLKINDRLTFRVQRNRSDSIWRRRQTSIYLNLTVNWHIWHCWETLKDV